MSEIKWKQNSTVLRTEMRKGYAIRDASARNMRDIVVAGKTINDVVK